MLKTVAVILLLAHMALGLYIWLEDHDDNRLRVIRLGTVIVVAVILLAVIYFIGN
jgi:heme/copper-type cytochrome/quinol oxidase subunit 4